MEQWNHIFPISSGNSRCLRFSGRCPFGRMAGRFLAPIAQKWPFFGLKMLFFSTLCPYNPLFWAQTDPDQWENIFPISQGNFGCIWFSGRCPFVCSAGRFPAPIAQKGPFLAKNAMSGLVRSGLLWYDPFWSGVVLSGLVQSGPVLSSPVVPVRSSPAQFSPVHSGLVWSDLVCSSPVWSGLVWSSPVLSAPVGLVRSSSVRFSLVLPGLLRSGPVWSDLALSSLVQSGLDRINPVWSSLIWSHRV